VVFFLFFTIIQKQRARWNNQNIIKSQKKLKLALKELFVFSQWFFFFVIIMPVRGDLVFNQVYKNKVGACVVHSARLGGAHVLRAAHASSLDIPKYFSIMSLKVSPHHFSNSVACVNDNGLICYWWVFFPFLFSLLHWKSQLGPLCYWYFNFNYYFNFNFFPF
jgi:hypothetical protein